MPLAPAAPRLGQRPGSRSLSPLTPPVLCGGSAPSKQQLAAAQASTKQTSKLVRGDGSSKQPVGRGSTNGRMPDKVTELLEDLRQAATASASNSQPHSRAAGGAAPTHVSRSPCAPPLQESHISELIARRDDSRAAAGKGGSGRPPWHGARPKSDAKSVPLKRRESRGSEDSDGSDFPWLCRRALSPSASSRSESPGRSSPDRSHSKDADLGTGSLVGRALRSHQQTEDAMGSNSEASHSVQLLHELRAVSNASSIMRNELLEQASCQADVKKHPASSGQLHRLDTKNQPERESAIEEECRGLREQLQQFEEKHRMVWIESNEARDERDMLERRVNSLLAQAGKNQSEMRASSNQLAEMAEANAALNSDMLDMCMHHDAHVEDLRAECREQDARIWQLMAECTERNADVIRLRAECDAARALNNSTDHLEQMSLVRQELNDMRRSLEAPAAVQRAGAFAHSGDEAFGQEVAMLREQIVVIREEATHAEQALAAQDADGQGDHHNAQAEVSYLARQLEIMKSERESALAAASCCTDSLKHHLSEVEAEARWAAQREMAAIEQFEGKLRSMEELCRGYGECEDRLQVMTTECRAHSAKSESLAQELQDEQRRSENGIQSSTATAVSEKLMAVESSMDRSNAECEEHVKHIARLTRELTAARRDCLEQSPSVAAVAHIEDLEERLKSSTAECHERGDRVMWLEARLTEMESQLQQQQEKHERHHNLSMTTAHAAAQATKDAQTTIEELQAKLQEVTNECTDRGKRAARLQLELMSARRLSNLPQTETGMRRDVDAQDVMISQFKSPEDMHTGTELLMKHTASMPTLSPAPPSPDLRSSNSLSRASLPVRGQGMSQHGPAGSRQRVSSPPRVALGSEALGTRIVSKGSDASTSICQSPFASLLETSPQVEIRSPSPSLLSSIMVPMDETMLFGPRRCSPFSSTPPQRPVRPPPQRLNGQDSGAPATPVMAEPCDPSDGVSGKKGPELFWPL
eukprot:gnl/TRDRNA2_/TRDRNA2_163853_c0_seq1.p1 gnl/TRDRNA2_/TRDRNA2_163853_c0~~gnl/TRDRNA2_/TRDRNA2_163853_c0_seq1.p1  ORF type:complete len:987 (+),score=212.76 gnl/TRDRNA2_/TRDRNA2_163853_c0_seq1:66-3026(+)